jgi:hypothetical protein
MAILASLCAAYLLYCFATNPAGPLTTAESLAYMNVSPSVPLGYPLFLKISGLRGAIVVQPLLLAAALFLLGRETLLATRKLWVAALVMVIFMAPPMRAWQATLLPHALFLSLAIVFVALSVRFAYRPSWHWMVLVASAAGLSATVHRGGFAFVPAMLLMVLIQRRRLTGSQPVLFFVAALAPFLVILGLEQAAAALFNRSSGGL